MPQLVSLVSVATEAQSATQVAFSREKKLLVSLAVPLILPRAELPVALPAPFRYFSEYVLS